MSHFFRPVYSYSLPPHQRNHTLYSDHYYPNWEIASPQINGDPGRPPILYEPPSCNGGYVYLNPAECHGCCAHSYFSIPYGFRPPHSHPSPPPFPHYYHGPYPPYPEATSPYLVPPPHYSVGQPRYDYDKIVPGNHCCGCPNHKCSSKVGSNVRIEEQDPEVEKAEGKFPEPIKSGDCQKPIVWIPPGYMKEKDRKWLPESGPQVWSGGLPFDISNINSLKQSDEEGRKQDRQNEETGTHFPYPIIWMPAYEKPKEAETKDLKEYSCAPKSSEGIPPKQHQQNEDRRSHFPFPFFCMPAHDMGPEAEMNDLKEVTNGSKSAEEMPSKLKTIPVKKLPQNDDRGDKPGIANDTIGVRAKGAEEELKPISIPMKPMLDIGGKKSSGETGTEPKSIPVKQMKDNNANKASHVSTKIQPASPKASKLPPVCLRVDPLPRRKSTNGSSRSPSPPGEKGKLQKESDETLRSHHTGKESQYSRIPDSNLKKASEEQASKNDTEEKMRDNRKREDTRKSLRDVPVVAKEEVSGIPVKKESKIDGKEQNNKKEEVESKTEQLKDVKKKKKKNMSATEAAVLIQSAYRGYEVRKWEPLKKLRQVAKVRQQVEEVREHIHALESSPELRMDEKQKVIIGETIMGLLLQLDVIQGLHSSIRDIRKSVARELVSLQERLDSMTSQKPEESKLTTDELTDSAKQVVENLCQTDVVGVPPGLEEEEKPFELSESHSVALHGDGTELKEPSDESVESEQPTLEKECADSEGDEVVHASLTNEVLVDSREQCGEKILEPLVVDKEVQDNSEREAINTVVEPRLVKELIESPEMRSEEAHSKAVEMKPSMELNDEVKDPGTGPETLVTGEIKSKPLQPDELPLVMGERTESAADQLKEAIDDVNQSSTLQELPLEVREETQGCGSEQNVDEHDTRKREEPSTQSSDSDVKHEVTKEENPLVESAESADYDPKKPGFSNVQPSGKEELRDEELLKIPKLEDSAQILQVVDDRSNEEKLTEDQMVANVGSSQAVRSLPSDSTDYMVAPHSEDIEIDVKESRNYFTGERPISGTEVPKMEDESIVKEAGEDSLPYGQTEGVEEALEALDVQEENDISDDLETVTGNDGVDYKSCASDQMVEEVMSSSPKMEGEITSSDPVAQVNHDQPPKTMDDIEVGQVSLHNKDLVEDNEKLKEMLEKLVQAGKEQLTVISNLNGRIKDLERKLKMKKQRKMKPRRVAATLSSAAKRSTGLSKGNSVICAA